MSGLSLLATEPVQQRHLPPYERSLVLGAFFLDVDPLVGVGFPIAVRVQPFALELAFFVTLEIVCFAIVIGIPFHP